MSFFKIIADDARLISYRPALNAITGGVTSSILLVFMCDLWLRNNRKPFYKFKAPCSHAKFREGDSFTEALGFSRAEFETALKRISTKITKGVSRGDALEGSFVVYYTDRERVTYYEINEALVDEKLRALYLCKERNSLYINEKRETRFTLKHDNTINSFSFNNDNTLNTNNVNDKREQTFLELLFTENKELKAAFYNVPKQPTAEQVETMLEKYGEAYLRAQLDKMLEYYTVKRKGRKSLSTMKSFYLTLNNWLKKEHVDPTLAKMRDAFLETYKKHNELEYKFNAFDTGDDMQALISLKEQIESASSGDVDHEQAFRVFLENLPPFWQPHRLKALAKNFSSIAVEMRRKGKKKNGKGSKYAETTITPTAASWIKKK